MSRYAICPQCDGEGRHVNPAVDGNGITAEEMDELGDDFREDYLSGAYDVVCERCHGQRLVSSCFRPGCDKPVAEGEYERELESGELILAGGYAHCVDHLDDQERAAYEENADVEAMYESERRMGA